MDRHAPPCTTTDEITDLALRIRERCKVGEAEVEG